MDLNESSNKEASKEKNDSKQNALNKNQHGILPIDLPPSYSEAMQIHPYQDLSYSTPRPTAPLLETNNAISYPYNNYVPRTIPQTGGAYPQNDKRFEKWDKNATRIVINHRLQMNDQFQAAKSSWETELLWNIILNDLLIHGYHFTIFDLMQYWSCLFHTYASIVNSAVSTGLSTDWEYFKPMHDVFGNHNTSSLLDTTSISGTTVFPLNPGIPPTNSSIVPIVMTTPSQPNKVTQNLETPTTGPTGPGSGGDLPPTLSNTAVSASAVQVATDDRAPLLAQTTGDSLLQSEILTKSGNIVTESSTDPMPSAAATLLPASATLPSSSVVPVVMTMPPSEQSRAIEHTVPSPTLPGDAATAATGNVLPSGAAAQVTPSTTAFGSDAKLLASNQATTGLQSDAAVVGEPAMHASSAYEAVAAGPAVGNCASVTECLPPVEFSSGLASDSLGEASLAAAITSQPGVSYGTGLSKLLEDDGGVITSQPIASAANAGAAADSWSEDYGCCDNCCGESFCCGDDCYCDGGDCDLGDCGGF